jgi:micrococcal nuclease
MKNLNLSGIFKSLGVSPSLVNKILGVIVLMGGGFGTYTVLTNDQILNGEAAVYMSSVLDGDTFNFSPHPNPPPSGEGEVRIRLSEIDAPEVGECYFEESKNALQKVLLGEKLKLEKNISGVDNFGRLIRYVFVLKPGAKDDNIFVNKYMLENGYAKYFPDENVSYQKELVIAESVAKAKVVGLWKECKNEKNDARKESIGISPSDPNCAIKGNVSDTGFGKVYFPPHCANYNKVIVEPSKGERYFCSEKEAEKAGFSKAQQCN